MAGSRVAAQSKVDFQALYMATNAPGGNVREFMNNLRTTTADHLQRNAPRNSPLNELHRGRGRPPYADGFISDLYGNQNGSGFRMGNMVPHAPVVEYGRGVSRKQQYFTWAGAKKRGTWNPTTNRYRKTRSPKPGGWVSTRHTKARDGTYYLRNGVYYVAIRSGRRPDLNKGAFV